VTDFGYCGLSLDETASAAVSPVICLTLNRDNVRLMNASKPANCIISLSV
jgi:hypothetical protein